MHVTEALMLADLRTGQVSDMDQEALASLAAEVRSLINLAEDAYEEYQNDRDSKLGKLLIAMTDRSFREQYRPDLSSRDEHDPHR